MLIGLESPLRRLPASLNHKQILFLDAIRIAGEAADLVYHRLVETLLDLALDRYDRTERSVAIVSSVTDAWAMIDTSFRLRALLAHMPGMKQKTPGFQLFLRETAPVEDLRHFVQHLNREINNLAAAGSPVWGRLHWFVLLDPSTATIRSCTITAGTLFDGLHPLANPVGKDFHANVDYVTLAAGSASANLSDLMRRVERLVRELEQQLAAAFGDEPKRGSDMLITIEVSAPTESSANNDCPA